MFDDIIKKEKKPEFITYYPKEIRKYYTLKYISQLNYEEFNNEELIKQLYECIYFLENGVVK